MNDNKHIGYICVFYAKIENNRLLDYGADPDFENSPPSFGICRPNYRRKKDMVGKILVFIGYIRGEKKYYLKGWFVVQKNMKYIDALNDKRFQNRKNLIVRISNDDNICKNDKWKNKKLYKEYSNTNFDFLRYIKFNNTIYIQNPEDKHELDNWKCKRIFYCKKNQLIKCIKNNKCLKENEFDKQFGYIVGDEKFKDDFSGEFISWEEIKPDNFYELRTPRNQHNVLKVNMGNMENMVKKVKKICKRDLNIEKFLNEIKQKDTSLSGSL